MRLNRIILALGLSTILALAAMVSLAGAGPVIIRESNLNPVGQVFEVNADSSGKLWISDNLANEIWRVDPTNGQYTAYQGMNRANDAKMDTAGNVWWTDTDGYLGRIAPGTNTLTKWLLPGTTTPKPLGVTFDSVGLVWAGDDGNAQLFSLDPALNQICVYSYTVGVGSGITGQGNGFIAAQGGSIWVANGSGDSIIKVTPSSTTGALWQLAYGRSPQRPIFDASGNLWFAEWIQTSPDVRLDVPPRGTVRARDAKATAGGALAQLQPGTDKLTEYTLPSDKDPQSVLLKGDQLWYTALGTVGNVDTLLATKTISTVVQSTAVVTPTLPCSTVLGTNSTITIRTGTVSSTPATYAQVVNAGGWNVYQLPPLSQPWGIAGTGSTVWVTDQGRKILSGILSPYAQYLPFIAR